MSVASPLVGDPLQQPAIVAVERRAGRAQLRDVGIAAHLEHALAEAGVQADEIARLDRDAVRFEHAHQRVVADQRLAVAEVAAQVDHHAAALHAGRGHVLDPERGVADPRRRGKAVVVDDLRHAVAVGVEERADVAERVPLRRELEVQRRPVVADDVGEAGELRGEADSCSWAGPRARPRRDAEACAAG